MNKKEFVQGIIIMAITVVMAMVILEAALRISDNPQAPTKDEVLCIHEKAVFAPYKLKPNSETVLKKKEFETVIKTDSFGFREDEPAKNYFFRAIGAGDSFTFGWGVDNNEAYLKVAEKELADLKGVEILNAGIGGFNNLDSLNYTKEFSEKIDYNLLIFAVFMGNDIVDNLEVNPRFVREDGCLGKRDKEAVSQKQGIREFLYQNFYVVRFFSQLRYLPGINRLVVASQLGSQGEDNPNFNLFKVNQSEESADAFEETEKIIGEAKSFSEEKKIDLLVLLIPSKYQVYENIFWKDADKYALSRNDVNILFPAEKIKLFCGENSVAVLDATERMKVAASETEESFFYEIDGHLTVAGQRALGKILADELRQRFLD